MSQAVTLVHGLLLGSYSFDNFPCATVYKTYLIHNEIFDIFKTQRYKHTFISASAYVSI